jgi:AcrR family transcriptional regulator
VDGRSARRLRNVEAAVDAILELLDEGCATPTAQLVAERSGLSIRSIFRLFQDMDDLRSAAIARQEERFATLFHEVSADGSLEQRIAALVQARAALFEAISPVRRHALRVAAESPPIQAGLERTNRMLRQQINDVFASELGTRGATLHRLALVDSLDAVASWETWDRLRTRQGLPAPVAAETVAFLLSAALATVAPSPDST